MGRKKREYYNPMEDKMGKYVFGLLCTKLNLELSEWFMIKSKQQPLMSLRNLFKYLFVCESFHRLLSGSIHTAPNIVFSFSFSKSLWIHLGIFQRRTRQTKENKFSFLFFFSSLSISRLKFACFCFACAVAGLVAAFCLTSQKKTTHTMTHNDRWKCGKSFS